MTNKNTNWEEEFREYFDKILKPKKPTMKNLDRELCIDFISNLLNSQLKEIKEKISEDKHISDYLGGGYAVSLNDVDSIIDSYLKEKNEEEM